MKRRVILANQPVEADEKGRRDREHEHEVDGDLLETPGLGGLAGQVPPRVAEGVGQTAAAADP